MDCGRVEQLIALHVGGDLAPDAARAVSAHLQTCEDCRRSASDFEASREMLRAHEPPEFDAAFFDGVRRNVLSEIESATARNSFASLFSRLFNQRALAYAASVALLFAAGTLAFRFLSGRTSEMKKSVVESNASHSSNPAVATNTPTRNEYSPAATPSPTQHEIIAVQDKRVGDKRRAAVKSALRTTHTVGAGVTETHAHPSVVENVASVTNVTPPAANASIQSAEGAGAHEAASSASQQVAERKMLRIELQTSDPNVRIIWLTPQADASPNK